MTTYTVYVLWCKTNVTKLFIDYTTNLTQLIKYHREHAKHVYPRMFNVRLYKCIEQNGGWSNWNIQAHSICAHRDTAERKCYALLDELRTKMKVEPHRIDNSTADQLLHRDNRPSVKCTCGLKITRKYLVEHMTTRRHHIQIGMHLL